MWSQSSVRGKKMNEKENFSTLTGALAQTLIDKNRAYGNSYDESLDTWGLKAMGMRLEDKYNRIKYLLLHDELKENDEKLIDSLLDNAGYSILAINYLINHKMVSDEDIAKINQASKKLYDGLFQEMQLKENLQNK